MYPELTEAERFPRLSPRGRQFLHAMRQHPHAPIWNWPNGEQLNDAGLARVQQFANRLQNTTPIDSLEEPDWLTAHVDYCLTEVPFYRQRSRVGTRFDDLPTCARSDMAPQVWQFVPDDQPLDELIAFSSSGTTGQPMRTPHHPYSAACGVPLMEHAIQNLVGVKFRRGPGEVALHHFAAYPDAFTTAIVVSYLDEAGCIRVNLDPSAWRNPNDCVSYLQHWQAPIWLGDPVAFGALERLELAQPPQAILSSILQLSDGYARHLRERYGCPVLDFYAMTEAGLVAVRDESGHRILPPDLFVEILDDAGNRCAPGVRGEITLTGGRNPFLPLLRYRTGDYAALQIVGGHRILLDLIGRDPVEYLAESGEVVHSMQITRLMRRFPVRRYELKPVTNGYEVELAGDVDLRAVERELRHLFGDRLVSINASL